MKHDINSYMTKRAIADTLRRLLVNKKLEDISVSELARESNINRKTFYYHFSSTSDLLRWILQTDVIDKIAQIDLVSNYLDAVNFIIDYIEQNIDFINAIIRSENLSTIEFFLRRKIAKIYQESADKLELGALRGEASSDEEYLKMRNFITTISTEATIGSIIYWIEHPDLYTRSEMVKFIDIFMRRVVGNAIKSN